MGEFPLPFLNEPYGWFMTLQLLHKPCFSDIHIFSLKHITAFFGLRNTKWYFGTRLGSHFKQWNHQEKVQKCDTKQTVKSDTKKSQNTGTTNRNEQDKNASDNLQENICIIYNMWNFNVKKLSPISADLLEGHLIAIRTETRRQSVTVSDLSCQQHMSNLNFSALWAYLWMPGKAPPLLVSGLQINTVNGRIWKYEIYE